jgi:exosortase D (VPLPA-CTERM-specific)
MLMKADRAVLARSAPAGVIYLGVLAAAAILVAFIGFSGGLKDLPRRWAVQEEYSHGFLIPVIAVWLLWTRRDALRANIGQPSWLGPLIILLAALLHIVGKLSSLMLLPQLAFILALIGTVLAGGGIPLLKVTWLPIAFLLFAIPLPYVIDAGLSFQLQLLSSQIGVFFIRLFQIPVYLEGNVIDLGVYKLQVVEACSGLRYLYPLMSLGFLAAYLFQAPLWQRVLVFLSTIPITILMNSLRIGLVGVLVDHFGPQDADGFLHLFEGWIIFIACAGLLATVMYVLARVVSGKQFFDVFYAPKLSPTTPEPLNPPLRGDERPGALRFAPLIACLALLCTTGAAGLFVSARQEIVPDRRLFVSFPATLGDWRGRTSSLDTQTEHALGLTDYVLSDYAKSDNRSINLYVAYYANQRTGASPHSPAVCIPGNGWIITDLERTHYTGENSSVSLPFNRVIIAKGSQKQLVYYWFEERGMKIANEYWSKLALLRDALLENRTDGALVRLTTPVYAGEAEADADKRLREFMGIVVPNLAPYLPSPVPDPKQATNPLTLSLAQR